MATSKKSTIGNDLKLLFKEVEKQRSFLKSAINNNWRTDGEFRFSLSSVRESIQIKTITNENKLVDILAFLLEKETFFKQASERLGKDTEFKWQGFTVAEWENDITVRLTQLNIVKRQADLDKAEGLLNDSMSPEVRAELQIEAAKEILSKK